MSRKLPQFSGTGVATITPFDLNGSVDYPALDRVIEHVIEGGVDYIVALGTTGETTTISRKECQQILAHIVGCVGGRVPLVAGCFGDNDTQHLVDSLAVYDLDDFAAVMSASPAYLKPSQEGIYQHYMRMADASPRPIIIYNVPGRTSSNIHPETVLRLAESSEQFVGVKEASGAIDQALQIVKHGPEQFAVISGDDPITLPMTAAGAHGGISVIANVFPRLFSEMVNAALEGDVSTAIERNNALMDVHKWLYIDGNPAGIKAAMNWAGISEEVLRLPLVPMYPENRKRLVEELAAAKAYERKI